MPTANAYTKFSAYVMIFDFYVLALFAINVMLFVVQGLVFIIHVLALFTGGRRSYFYRTLNVCNR